MASASERGAFGSQGNAFTIVDGTFGSVRCGIPFSKQAVGDSWPRSVTCGVGKFLSSLDVLILGTSYNEPLHFLSVTSACQLVQLLFLCEFEQGNWQTSSKVVVRAIATSPGDYHIQQVGIFHQRIDLMPLVFSCMMPRFRVEGGDLVAFDLAVIDHALHNLVHVGHFLSAKHQFVSFC